MWNQDVLRPAVPLEGPDTGGTVVVEVLGLEAVVESIMLKDVGLAEIH